MHDDSSSMWRAVSTGATAQPSRHPVMACDLEKLEMLTVRSPMPGSTAALRCG